MLLMPDADYFQIIYAADIDAYAAISAFDVSESAPPSLRFSAFAHFLVFFHIYAEIFFTSWLRLFS